MSWNDCSDLDSLSQYCGQLAFLQSPMAQSAQPRRTTNSRKQLRRAVRIVPGHRHYVHQGEVHPVCDGRLRGLVGPDRRIVPQVLHHLGSAETAQIGLLSPTQRAAGRGVLLGARMGDGLA